jgi:hypothetical protein
LRLGKESFRLLASQEASGEILFRLRILNSVWILILAIESEVPLVAMCVSEALHEGFAGVLI